MNDAINAWAKYSINNAIGTWQSMTCQIIPSRFLSPVLALLILGVKLNIVLANV